MNSAPQPARAASYGSIGLDERRIVSAALDILHSQGVDGLTMRALAERLGGSVGAAYKHVASKHELLRLVTLALFAQAEAADQPELEPLERVKHLLVGIWAVLAPYEGLVAYVSEHMADMAPAGFTSRVNEALIAAGFRDEGPQRAMRVLFFYTTGALLTRPAAGSVPAATLDEWFEDGLTITLSGLQLELARQTR